MIGLFLGETDFPNLILSNIKKNSIEYFIIDLSSKGIFRKNKNSKKISIGQFGKIINLIKKKIVKKFYLQVELQNQIYHLLNLILRVSIICQE